MSPQSLFLRANLEAERHKYLESQKAGRDLGHQAIADWHRRHWTLWLRERWLEHLLGTTRYEEFEPERFARLPALFAERSDLLAEVVEMVRRGAENADILFWAASERRDLRVVVRILVELRLNEIRCSRYCFDFARTPP
ncbi:MAG: hypothetical protein ACLF0G_14060 [Candidatus Brocadiia bacterium]